MMRLGEKVGGGALSDCDHGNPYSQTQSPQLVEPSAQSGQNSAWISDCIKQEWLYFLQSCKSQSCTYFTSTICHPLTPWVWHVSNLVPTWHAMAPLLRCIGHRKTKWKLLLTKTTESMTSFHTIYICNDSWLLDTVTEAEQSRPPHTNRQFGDIEVEGSQR